MGKVIPLFRSKDTGTTYEVEQPGAQSSSDSSKGGELRDFPRRDRRRRGRPTEVSTPLDRVRLCAAARRAARNILKMSQGRFSPTRLRNMQELVRDYSDEQLEDFFTKYASKRGSLDKPAFAYAIAKEADRRFCLLSDRIRH